MGSFQTILLFVIQRLLVYFDSLNGARSFPCAVLFLYDLFLFLRGGDLYAIDAQQDHGAVQQPPP